ncbi:hypothetical protein BT96DRAFT_820371 [Gymnopus androsaceus JB14]|uniref:BED-type domain-containing protein n=1 Tax=Gymnopus androsaceus JB14 TaxID=1447944 RepID=A0A6A4HNK6_9AGAR|nr:hypothetical protein BT96DRAFT_820371 [Gymnopus androsaceus JB14]
MFLIFHHLERARTCWNSPIYGFFSEDIVIGYDAKNGKYHYFKCNTTHCKGKGGVRCYQKMDDRSSTSNLKKHAMNCFGQDAVDAATIGANSSTRPDGSIFAAFGRQGARPVTVTHKAHSNAEIRAHLVRWITESNRSIRIVEDCHFRELMLAGQPQAKLPGRRTVARDIKSSFERCEGRINQLLQNYPGRLNFATDAWTSPNHRAMAAWTVHLQHEGEPLVFLLDIFEVPKVRHLLFYYYRQVYLTTHTLVPYRRNFGKGIP